MRSSLHWYGRLTDTFTIFSDDQKIKSALLRLVSNVVILFWGISTPYHRPSTAERTFQSGNVSIEFRKTVGEVRLDRKSVDFAVIVKRYIESKYPLLESGLVSHFT